MAAALSRMGIAAATIGRVTDGRREVLIGREGHVLLPPEGDELWVALAKPAPSRPADSGAARS